MCNITAELSRRVLLGGTGAALGAETSGSVASASRKGAKPKPVEADTHRGASSGNTKVVLLGVAGGPGVHFEHAGIASAVMVGTTAYLVDCGAGVLNQLAKADIDVTGRGFLQPDSSLRPASARLERIFLTHLHSDHVVDYFGILLTGWPNQAVHAFGPGRMSQMPRPARPGEYPVVDPLGITPLPGITDLTTMCLGAFAYDINTRIRDEGRTNLVDLIKPHDVVLPAGIEHDYVYEGTPPDIIGTAPTVEPFEVLPTDENGVTVSATLVNHAPVFPTFAYRFDTPDGSVVFSGDTAPSDNLINLAQGADVLVHEALDQPYMGSLIDKAFEAFGEGAATLASTIKEHLFSSHTFSTDVGKVAAAAGVKTLALNHLAPADHLVPERTWLDNAQQGFTGKVVLGEDLLELHL